MLPKFITSSQTPVLLYIPSMTWSFVSPAPSLSLLLNSVWKLIPTPLYTLYITNHSSWLFYFHLKKMNRMNNNVHTQERSVPFAWENEPGVSKVMANEKQEWRSLSLRLPPPPCPQGSARFSVHDDIQIPLPPCAFQPPSRSSSKKGLDEDPFFAAFKECTKTTTTAKSKFVKFISQIKRGVCLISLVGIPCKKDEENWFHRAWSVLWIVIYSVVDLDFQHALVVYWWCLQEIAFNSYLIFWINMQSTLMTINSRSH